MATARPLDFSYSKFSLYRECPRKYQFRYIERIPEKPKTYFAFGHSVHNALEFLYNVKAPPFPTLAEVMRVFEDEWKSKTPEQKGYTSLARAEQDFGEGVRQVKEYYNKHFPTLHVPLATEFKTVVPVDGLAVIIIVDRIDYLGPNKIGIVDYKTGKAVPDEPYQLRMYQKMLELSPAIKSIVAERGPAIAKAGAGDGEDLFGGGAAPAADAPLTVERLSFYHVPTLEEQVYPRAPDEDIAGFWKEVLAVADNVRAKKFEPLVSDRGCAFCDYKALCPAWKTAAPAISQPAAKVAMPAPAASSLEAVAARYGELLEELERLEREIPALMAGQGTTAAFGKGYELKLDAGVDFARDKAAQIAAVLKEAGLYEKALALTAPAVARLLADKTVPQTVKDKLLALASKKQTIKCYKVAD